MATTVTGMRADGGGSGIASNGKTAPSVKGAAEENAACHGLVNSCG